MRIYFINKNSKLKGPGYVNLADGKKLDVGDICIVCNTSMDYPSKVLLLNENMEAWEKCTLIEECSTPITDEWPNFLLYSFDGVSNRQGEIDSLNVLSELFDDSIFGKLLRNAISILKYESDHLEAEILIDILSAQRNNKTDRTNSKNENTHFASSEIEKKNFLDFLPLDIRQEIYSMLNSNIIAKEVLENIRSKYGVQFRKAFLDFKKIDPNGSIYKGLNI